MENLKRQLGSRNGYYLSAQLPTQAFRVCLGIDQNSSIRLKAGEHSGYLQQRLVSCNLAE